MSINNIILFFFFLSINIFLYGCAAPLLYSTAAITGAGVVKVAGSAEPNMTYSVQKNEIEIYLSTYSSNIISVKNMADVAAAKIASEIGCKYLEITYAKWPNSLLNAVIKFDTIVVYECLSNRTPNIPVSTGVVGAIIDVKKKLKYERDLLDTIENKQLLKKKG